MYEMTMVYRFDTRPWMIGYSGGKDSTMLVKLIFQMIARLPVDDRKKPIFIITSDTMVENPIVENYMLSSSRAINAYSEANQFNVHSIIVKPEISQTFWSVVIGLGYPTPELPGFRWCTERLKINSMNKYTQQIIDKYGEIILLLGVRKGESLTRQKSIESKEIEGKLLNPHSSLSNTYVYNPLTEIPNRLVWEFLLENNGVSEWGTNLKQLFNMYQGLDLSEEKSVLGEIDKDKIPVTGNSRFGCWCCTIVKEDKSLMNFINKGAEELIPLRDFRNWLIEIRKDPTMRDNKRRNGSVYTKADGSVGLGPFTLEARGIILKNLLQMEKDLREKYVSFSEIELISLEELKYIDTLWEEEGDLSRRKLVDIYYEVFGERLPWDEYKVALFSDDIIKELERTAELEGIPFELISKLLTSIEKNKHYVRGNKVEKNFDRIMAQGWLHDGLIKEALKDEN
ncbi:MAG: DNA phosphorothioation system sulfurtransferase DndC [Lachnospiraceae bacterium]|nr:DNA phosphorothioation system sulfurtransferase DndC [Lachnospiraceae bacterium]